MNKTELIRRVNDLLRENDVKKPISVPKQVFHISDDEGNTKDFTIKKVDKTAIYTVNDVAAVIDACLAVIQDALKHGEDVNIYGFGTLGLRYRKPHMTKEFRTGNDVLIEGHYVPKFIFGNKLKMCAKIYDLSLENDSTSAELNHIDHDNSDGE